MSTAKKEELPTLGCVARKERTEHRRERKEGKDGTWWCRWTDETCQRRRRDVQWRAYQSEEEEHYRGLGSCVLCRSDPRHLRRHKARRTRLGTTARCCKQGDRQLGSRLLHVWRNALRDHLHGGKALGGRQGAGRGKAAGLPDGPRSDAREAPPVRAPAAEDHSQETLPHQIARKRAVQADPIPGTLRQGRTREAGTGDRHDLPTEAGCATGKRFRSTDEFHPRRERNVPRLFHHVREGLPATR
mmetsp:Transcript_1056/g.6710  ORF Transcript_1056/g.6710 Transcript_1056/m.6710 type:complete len:244 (-) Transcript_1056:781-1512(-)